MQRKQFRRKTRDELAADSAHQENQTKNAAPTHIEQEDNNLFTLLPAESIQAIFDYIPDKRPLMAVSRQFRDNAYTWLSRRANQFVRQFIRNKFALTLADFNQCQLTLREIHAYHTYFIRDDLPVANKIFEYSVLLLALLHLMQAAPRYTKIQIVLNRGCRENAFVIANDATDAEPLCHYSAVNDDDIKTMREYIITTFPTFKAADIDTSLSILIQQASQLNTSNIAAESTLAMRFIKFFRHTDTQINLFERQLRICIEAICNDIECLRKATLLIQP